MEAEEQLALKRNFFWGVERLRMGGPLLVAVVCLRICYLAGVRNLFPVK
jgi:hypothetical protein